MTNKNDKNITDNEILEFYKKVSLNVKKLRIKNNITQLRLAAEFDFNSPAFYGYY